MKIYRDHTNMFLSKLGYSELVQRIFEKMTFSLVDPLVQGEGGRGEGDCGGGGSGDGGGNNGDDNNGGGGNDNDSIDDNDNGGDDKDNDVSDNDHNGGGGGGGGCNTATAVVIDRQVNNQLKAAIDTRHGRPRGGGRVQGQRHHGSSL